MAGQMHFARPSLAQILMDTETFVQVHNAVISADCGSVVASPGPLRAHVQRQTQ